MLMQLDATLGCKGSKSSPGPFIHVLSANGKDICPSLEKPNSTLANIMDIMGLGGETCPISDVSIKFVFVFLKIITF